ncbi:ABC transporter ATP-binding protein [Wenzhouxiangella marina]|uniref:ABC-type antimicrobial peptide transport system, ATPase component n=1 Tax=Wenzhouxiangella marina TaxID=1579979 RepID=A0A0K0XS89_9GAMM|nr:ABC transporter ATP-binding protein [Wenzhouxiangella marina]AKS40487.1 ABC-type antimicrobial peptide transport system, ATPase component [Wenzhouxiangella marina]MBB6088191.1 putative ABC transport system ATP-binding protein [Wenzhouxiangella marina]
MNESTVGEVLVRARGLGKDYQMGDTTVHALKSVDCDIRRGEFVAIMGPSGSGKSTFMNLVGALDKPSRGELSIAGRSIAELNSDQLAALRNRILGFVFQQFMLLPKTSAVDNARLPLMYTRMAPEEKDRRAREALQRVGLGERMDHTPAQLSGGQQQRVAIARALVNRPQMILADEPTGALDTATAEDIMRLLGELNEEGVTVVLVTHEEDIAAHARRIIRFRDGEIIEDSAAGATA